MSGRKLTSGERIMVDVEAMRARAEAEDRRVREALVKHLTASWAIVEEALGAEEAAQLWQSIPPKRPRGHQDSPEKTARDTLALMKDYANRYPAPDYLGETAEGEPIRATPKGMTAEESAVAMAGYFGLSDDPQNARRTLDRLWASDHGQGIKRLFEGSERDS